MSQEMKRGMEEYTDLMAERDMKEGIERYLRE